MQPGCQARDSPASARSSMSASYGEAAPTSVRCAMAASYGADITRPAANAREAVQWTYCGYLGAIKEANGAAMSIGRVSSFLDIFIERDLKRGDLDEAGAQELIDQFVQKLRIVRFLRTPDYDALFSGDPYWATECVGGMDLNGRPLVTRTMGESGWFGYISSTSGARTRSTPSASNNAMSASRSRG